MNVSFYHLVSVISIPLPIVSLLATFGYLHHKQVSEQQHVQTSLYANVLILVPTHLQRSRSGWSCALRKKYTEETVPREDQIQLS